MSRSLKYDRRRHKKRSKKDKDWNYVSTGCQHNNSCAYCRDNRTFSNKRREPLVDKI